MTESTILTAARMVRAVLAAQLEHYDDLTSIDITRHRAGIAALTSYLAAADDRVDVHQHAWLEGETSALRLVLDVIEHTPSTGLSEVTATVVMDKVLRR
ncbi:MAG: hypothetical protein LLG14_12650 [Nocardiaceae bacterium]|nr:hypothetical protein [Nocardiaceae bacterium]